ncbi:unnamed protein product [Coffea canephora]|uniref:Uncharacterized protein n=1 Tax=Coffea canephora TaxID=49390 RepID=A0A068U0W0_COFCA|nr:unnamed protein product [Coffea canephora]
MKQHQESSTQCLLMVLGLISLYGSAWCPICFTTIVLSSSITWEQVRQTPIIMILNTAPPSRVMHLTSGQSYRERERSRSGHIWRSKCVLVLFLLQKYHRWLHLLW